MKNLIHVSAAAVLGLAGLSQAAIDNTIYVPTTTPTDETSPRAALGDAPTGYGPDSWQGPSSGKSNVYFTPTQLFGATDANITLADIASITYYSKNAAGTNPSQNWFAQIYTNPQGPGTGDNASWYHDKFSDGGGTTDSTGGWDLNSVTSVFQQYTNQNNGAEFDIRPLTGTGSIADVYGTQGVLYFSLQTNSLQNGNDAQIDGLTVTLNNGDVAHVDLTPEPATLGMFGLGGLTLLRRRRR